MRDQKVCILLMLFLMLDKSAATLKFCSTKTFLKSLFNGSFVYNQGEVQYFIGVQLDGSQHVEPLQNSIPEDKATESAKLV